MNYNELTISQENQLLEQKVIDDISDCIKDESSWVFDAGAGAGKTYALIQTLKLIIKKSGAKLKAHNQKILCITYTNVATNEIKERLGTTTLVEVSTIHECIWRIIAPHQELLIKTHLEKLDQEIKYLSDSLSNEEWAQTYRELAVDKRLSFDEAIIANSKLYYRHKGERASDFREALHEINELFPTLWRSVDKFRKIADAVIKIREYEDVIVKMHNKEMGFTKVKYDARFNNDRLVQMIISHDTLLDYMHSMVCESDLLKQVVCDKYPFILVDEYQDTSPQVIKTLNMLEKYANSIGHICLIGYYGDIKQNIYESGVGGNFYDIHENIKRVEKVFNRRSSSEIISIANCIRNDGLQQQSIFEKFPPSDVRFYNINNERQEIIDKLSDEWKIDKKNKLHCFELTNEKVAEQSGFAEIYNFFKNSEWYKIGRRYKLLREHVLSLDQNKLGIVQRLLFNILDFKYRLKIDSTLLLELFRKNQIKEMNIESLRNLIDKLQSLSGNTLREYVEQTFQYYDKGDDKYDKCIEYVIPEKIKSVEELTRFILNTLFYFTEDEDGTKDDYSENEAKVNQFLDIDMSIFELWYNFVTNSCSGNVVFHTYHGTKGWEFDNVIIFMNSRFGRKNQFFADLLDVLNDKNEREERESDLESARNLLYVAVTRATKNLCVVYFDYLNGKISKVESVFGKVQYSL